MVRPSHGQVRGKKQTKGKDKFYDFTLARDAAILFPWFERVACHVSTTKLVNGIQIAGSSLLNFFYDDLKQKCTVENMDRRKNNICNVF